MNKDQKHRKIKAKNRFNTLKNNSTKKIKEKMCFQTINEIKKNLGKRYVTNYETTDPSHD